MGSSQSTSFSHRGYMPRRVESSGRPSALHHHDSSGAATSQQTGQTPAQTAGGGMLPRPRVGRRRSSMKFPSLSSKRKRRNVAETGDHRQGDVDEPSSLLSCRRWRSTSRGRRSHPINSVTDSDTLATSNNDDDSSAPKTPPPIASIPEHSSSEKGKGRAEESATDAGQRQLEDRAHHEPIIATSSSVHSSDGLFNESGPTSSSDTVPHEVQGLQTSGDGSPSIAPRANGTGVTDAHIGRSPTPIPASVLDPGHLERSESGRSDPDPTLSNVLGSWLSGRPQRETAEPPANDTTLTSSSSHSSITGQPTTLGVVNRSVDSTMPSTNTRDPESSARETTDMPTSPRPIRPGSGGPFGPSGSSASAQQPERRNLAPGGTGTLVVVQGVVHTTDVRNNRAPSPSRSPTQSASSTHPAPSGSSTSTPTPTLRTTLGSRSPSRPSTPQLQSQSQPSRRSGRFSSLANNLRPRSRRETVSSQRSVGSLGISLGGTNANGAASALRHGNCDLNMDGNAPETDHIGSTTTADASTPNPNGSLREGIDSRGEIVNTIDGFASPRQSTSTSRGDRTQRRDGDSSSPTSHADSDANDASEEESDAELSASSIEVLGTLLSVATAATAASLVSGSTEPLFSSGLAGSNPSAPNRDAAHSRRDSNIGLSPTVHDVESSVSAGSDANTNAEAPANTRMRAAWESLRDRFSRRGRRGAVEGNADEREDPREQMLREMARAFNTGLGLDSEDNIERPEPGTDDGNHGIGDSPPYEPPFSESGPSNRQSDQRPSGEGNFERFLHNLQLDLRTALMEDYAARRAGVQTGDAGSNAGPSLSNTPARASTIDADGLSATANPVRRQEDGPSSQGNNGDQSNPRPPAASTIFNPPRPTALDLPSLSSDAGTSPNDSTAGNGRPQAHGITGQPGAGINWWRLYRFPPMQLAPSGVASPTGATQDHTVPFERPSSSQHGGADPHQLPAAFGPPPDSDPNRDVVPVIVVGLQSVAVNRGDDLHLHHHHQHHSGIRSPQENHTLDGDPDLIPGRERAWPLRAASRALGRLGRRNDAETSANDGGNTSSGEGQDPASPSEGRQGGRTYLIFVIGGYYPPNHSIVTGSEDMNSFETLWDLAELLGQVKPPVASKEDIEKSGLEIIKASTLSDYEKAGKVASNTVERCLICLDDYDHADDLRLLSCRHIFHKQCVDKWLEHGRNNCPACRTKGVRTADETPASIPTSNNQG